MSDIELVIKIPKETVKEIKDNAMFAKDIANNIKWDVTSAIVNSTPLPKRHGRIVCEDAVIEWLKDKDIIKMSYQENNAREDMLKSVPTIIQADKEEREE